MIPEEYRSVDSAVFVHDPETGEILDVNETACELYGYSRAEARRLCLADLTVGVPPYTQATAVEYVRKAAAGNPQEFDWRAKDSEGNHFRVELSMRRTVIDDRTRVVVIARDITERTRHEQALEQLHTTTRELLTAESPTEIASITCEATTEILALPLVGVHLYDGETDALVPAAWSDALSHRF